MHKKSISVFMPAYNEGENIESAVKDVYHYIQKTFSDFEIIIIDDGSTDDTYQKLMHLKRKKLITKIIHHTTNLGYGASLRDGFKNSSKELIFYTDADNQFRICDLDTLYPLLKKADIISAYRLKRADPFTRIVTAHMYNMLLSILFPIQIKDIDASFKLYKREVFDNMVLKAQTGLIDAEILIKAQKQRFRIIQIGVNHYPRVKGKTIYEIGKKKHQIALVKPKVIVDIFREIYTLWPDLR